MEKFDIEEIYYLLADLDNKPKNELKTDDLCRFFYSVVKKLSTVDSFYVGLYDEEIEELFFPMTVDEGRFDVSDSRPLGDGPTSWVIRNRKPFILTEETRFAHQRGTHFGNRKKSSASAIHNPMFAKNSEGEEILVGVISIQSYKKNVFGENVIRAFGTITNSAAKHFLPYVEVDAIKRLRKRNANQATLFNSFLFEIMQMLSEMKDLCGLDVDGILASIDRCTEYCESIQMNMGSGDLGTPSPKDILKQESLSKLTPVQLKTLELAMEGMSYSNIAVELKMSRDAVKKNMQKISDTLMISPGKGRKERLFKKLR